MYLLSHLGGCRGVIPGDLISQSVDSAPRQLNSATFVSAVLQVASVAIQERFREVGAMLDESNLLDSKNALFSISPEQRSPGLFLVLQVRQPHFHTTVAFVRRPSGSMRVAMLCCAGWGIGVQGAAGRPGQGAGAVCQGQGQHTAAQHQGARGVGAARTLPTARGVRVLPGTRRSLSLSIINLLTFVADLGFDSMSAP